MVDSMVLSVKAFVIGLLLGNRHSGKRIASVVNIRVLGGFVFHSSLVLLAADNQVALESLLVKYKFSVYSSSLGAISHFHENVH